MKATSERYNNVSEVEKKVFVPIALRYEYVGYTGEYRYCIYTGLTAEELKKQYGEVVEKYEPYLLMTWEQYEARAEFIRNEDKFKKRRARSEGLYGYEEGISECVHSELQSADVMEEVLAMQENAQLMEALEQLTSIQKRRLIAHFFENQSSRTIATEEGVNYSKVDNSIKSALIKLKKILAQ